MHKQIKKLLEQIQATQTILACAIATEAKICGENNSSETFHALLKAEEALNDAIKTKIW